MAGIDAEDWARTPVSVRQLVVQLGWKIEQLLVCQSQIDGFRQDGGVWEVWEEGGDCSVTALATIIPKPATVVASNCKELTPILREGSSHRLSVTAVCDQTRHRISYLKGSK